MYGVEEGHAASSQVTHLSHYSAPALARRRMAHLLRSV